VPLLVCPQVLACAQAHLNHFTIIRIEDLVAESLQTRRDNVASILTSLSIPFTDDRLSELAKLFDKPIDAPDDFRTSHYGRWKQVHAPVSPRSGEISTKVGVDSALRNMVVKGRSSQRQDTFMGVDVCQLCYQPP